jgi:hypothetical protein
MLGLVLIESWNYCGCSECFGALANAQQGRKEKAIPYAAASRSLA